MREIYAGRARDACAGSTTPRLGDRPLPPPNQGVRLEFVPFWNERHRDGLVQPKGSFPELRSAPRCPTGDDASVTRWLFRGGLGFQRKREWLPSRASRSRCRTRRFRTSTPEPLRQQDLGGRITLRGVAERVLEVSPLRHTPRKMGAAYPAALRAFLAPPVGSWARHLATCITVRRPSGTPLKRKQEQCHTAAWAPIRMTKKRRGQRGEIDVADWPRHLATSPFRRAGRPSYGTPSHPRTRDACSACALRLCFSIRSS